MVRTEEARRKATAELFDASRATRPAAPGNRDVAFDLNRHPRLFGVYA